MNKADVGNGAALDAEMLDLLVEDVSAETELNEDGCCLGSFGTEGTCGSFGGTFGTFGTLGSLGCACI